jgi:hypothetical protein
MFPQNYQTTTYDWTHQGVRCTHSIEDRTKPNNKAPGLYNQIFMSNQNYGMVAQNGNNKGQEE